MALMGHQSSNLAATTEEVGDEFGGNVINQSPRTQVVGAGVHHELGARFFVCNKHTMDDVTTHYNNELRCRNYTTMVRYCIIRNNYANTEVKNCKQV